MLHAYIRLSEVAAAALRDSLGEAAAASGLEAEYPSEAAAEALKAVEAYRLPELDLTHLPFVTIDPQGSTDLDQALWIEAEGAGWRVYYAIADVPGFVVPGGALDAATRQRGETAYLPLGRVPLHPEAISEDAGSLLPGQLRGAYVWDVSVAEDGTSTLNSLRTARVRSTEQLSYPEAQARLEAGEPLMVLLHGLGEARRADEARRHGANLALPEQEIAPSEGGGFRLEARIPLPIEEDNAQVSLMTGMCAAALMLEGKIGLLRTMPAPDARSISRFRAVTVGLGTPWGKGQDYGEYLRGLDVTQPKQLAIMHSAGSLFRGAAYTAFDGQAPEQPVQAAVGAPYAHTTAPLRRLVDRFVLVLCHALANGLEVPAWVREALPTLPEAMKAAGSAISGAERRSLDIVEASLLAGSVGRTFPAIVVDGQVPGTRGDGKGRPSVKVSLIDPPVEARAEGSAESGTVTEVTVLAADVATGTVRLALPGVGTESPQPEPDGVDAPTGR